MGLGQRIRKQLGKTRAKLRNRLSTPEPSESLDNGLARINERLGLHSESRSDAARPVTTIRVEPTHRLSRSIYYAPDMDGQAEPGEVVWIWAPSDGPAHPPRERAVLVVGRTRHTILGLLISPNPEHDGEEHWLDIGAGEWDASGRQCWIRLDRVLEAPERGIRRQGTLFPQPRFERIANKLRSSYQWA
ncbi:type II toxin-antitoxin system PemK/MazF family toxin [Corynebacterium halotolerans]|uniref:PemK-like protein n=1 Tax=Corynebacterium halotolerans YIM 70093 = DSM 44683 TaxID=1121362 RepID=M1P914_9CORY|nr:hypothetical protein [Corynebacterium halotolerans]AGF73171.1 hypothetical protein A605_10855 [Corynebacterium halotolerans YIM 70093 = DSM 44683]